MAAGALAVSLTLVCAGTARAAEHVHRESPEAWAMFYFASVTLFCGLGTPKSRRPGELELGLDGATIPHLGRRQRTVGFAGTKEEDLNKAPIFARIRATVGLPWKLSLSLGYVPPVRVFGVRPHLVALALERPLLERGPWTLGARLYGQVGRVKGAFTCPGKSSRFAPGSPQNPFGCEGTSNDRAVQRYVGLELSASRRIARLRGLAPYLSIAGNYLDTRVRVKARTFGFLDRTRLAAGAPTVTFGAGLRLPLSERLDVAIGFAYTPLWVQRPPDTSDEHEPLVHLRSALSYAFR